MLTPAMKREIGEICGVENVIDSNLDMFTYSYDASPLPLMPARNPDLAVYATSTEQLCHLMAYANQHRVPVVPRGSGSGRSGGSMPIAGGIALCFEKMNRILELDEQNCMVTVEPGVRTFDLYSYCAARGLFYPPDPASWKFCTIGGNIAENAGGPKAVKYGVTRDYVMGLTVVLPGGQVLETGGKAIKNVTGYDLTRLFVGSEGTLGIVTRAILRLLPLPRAQKTAQVMFTTMDAACECVRKTIRSGIIPAAAEIMDKVSIQAVARLHQLNIDAAIEACIIYELDGEDEHSLTSQAEGLRKVCQECGAAEFRLARDQQEAEDLWSIRRALGPAVATLAPNRIGEDISVPRSAFPEVVKRLQQISRKYGLTIAIYGHAGDGNLHPSILTDLSLPGAREKVDQAVAEVFQAALDLGGTLSGEHGIGLTKKDYIVQALGEVGVATLRSIKAAIDPNGIMNPGKIFS
ncbi:MAG: FAD-binding oxidoreductase [Desulfobaccales bacterium]